MIRHVLLINPWIYDFAAYDFWYKPIGLLYLASFLRTNGFRISLIDCLDSELSDLHHVSHIRMPKRKPSGEGSYTKERIPKPESLQSIPRNFYRYGMTPHAFVNALKHISKPDAILITSMMTYWYTGLFHNIALLRMIFPGVPIILGGNYVTLCPNHAPLSGADFCLSGPGELSLPPLLKDLLNMDMPFLPAVHNLDSYAYPAFDLTRQRNYVPILTSRGCPFRCSYCASHLLTDRFRQRDPIRVANEIEYWYSRFDIKNYSFYDDALLLNAEDMIIPLLHEVIRKQLPIQFHCPNGLHLRAITPELSSLMYKSGFKTIRFGFETSDLARQKETGGKVTNQELREALGCLKFAGYRTEDIGIYILCGLPNQSVDEVRESILFVCSSGARPMLAEYSPIPGSDLWDDAVASSPYPIDEEPLFHNNTLLPCRSDSLTAGIYQTLKNMARCPIRSEVS